MRKIALDVGDKTVGIALSDALGITAQGLMTLERVGTVSYTHLTLPTKLEV